MKKTMSVWISQYSSLTPQDIANGVTEGLLYAETDMTSSGWTRVGTAVVEFTPLAMDEIISGKIKVIRAEIEEEQAKTHVRVKRLNDQINSLLALPLYEDEPF